MNSLHCARVLTSWTEQEGKGRKKKILHMNLVPNSVQLVEIDSWHLTNKFMRTGTRKHHHVMVSSAVVVIADCQMRWFKMNVQPPTMCKDCRRIDVCAQQTYHGETKRMKETCQLILSIHDPVQACSVPTRSGRKVCCVWCCRLRTIPATSTERG